MNFDEKYDWMMQCADDVNDGSLRESDEEILVNFLKDDDELIRATAVDILGNSHRDDILDAILTLAKKDSSYLVRSYCVASAMDIAGNLKMVANIVPCLKKLFYSERSLFAKLSWLSDLGLYMEQKDEVAVINLLDKGLKSRNRHYRNLAVEALLSNNHLCKLYSSDILFHYSTQEKCDYIKEKMLHLTAIYLGRYMMIDSTDRADIFGVSERSAKSELTYNNKPITIAGYLYPKNLK